MNDDMLANAEWTVGVDSNQPERIDKRTSEDKWNRKMWGIITGSKRKDECTPRELKDTQGIREMGVRKTKGLKIVVQLELQFKLSKIRRKEVCSTCALIKQCHWFGRMKRLIREVVKHYHKWLARKVDQ